MFESLRQNINDLVRTDRPESPTDLIFIFGSLVVAGLMIYAAQVRVTVQDYSIPHFEAYLLALGTYKGIKVLADKQQAKSELKAKEVVNADPATPQS